MIGSDLDASRQVDVVNLDFSKAFDSVNHNILIHKLQSFGINEISYLGLFLIRTTESNALF